MWPHLVDASRHQIIQIYIGRKRLRERKLESKQESEKEVQRKLRRERKEDRERKKKSEKVLYRKTERRFKKTRRRKKAENSFERVTGMIYVQHKYILESLSFLPFAIQLFCSFRDPHRGSAMNIKF